MKYVILFALVLLSLRYCPDVHAIELKDGNVVLTTVEREAMKNCEAQGGCAIFSRAEFEYIARQIMALAQAEAMGQAQAALDEAVAQTCKRRRDI